MILLITSLTLYILFAGRLTFSFPTNPANYFSHLSYSVLSGKLSLDNPSWDHDLSFFKGKKYMYWGPTPILFILPFMIPFGVNFSDALYTAILGAFGPLALYTTLSQMRKIGLARLSNFKIFLLCLFFAFGTVYFSVSVNGGVWFTSQAVTTLFSLISLALLLIYVKKKYLIYLLTSSSFLGLAIWGRNTFIFYLPFFLTLIIISHLKAKDKFSLGIKRLTYSLCVFLIILIIAGIYNYQRFGSVLESGYSYQKFALRFTEDKIKFGILNFAYIPHNFHYMFINAPKFINIFPYIKFDPEGNSFLLLSPLFFLVFYIFNKKYWKNLVSILFNLSIIFCILLIILFHLSFWGTGWLQFNYRYVLDAIPLIILLLARVVDDFHFVFVLSLFTISLAVNILGTLWLLNI